MLLRSTLIYGAATFFTRISALLLLVIATHLVNQTEYGLLTLVVTVGELTDSAVTNWLRITLLRLGGIDQVSKGSVALAARVLVITTLLSLVVSSAASALAVPERWSDFALAVGAYLVVGAISRFALTLLQMQRHNAAYSMLELLRAVLQLVLPVAAIGIFGGSFLVMSLGSSLGVLIAGLLALSFALGRTVPGPARFAHRELFALGVPLVAMALFGFGLNNAERIFLKMFYDASAVAIFAAAYALARQPIDMIANAINMGAFPELVDRFDKQGPSAAADFLSSLLALMLRLSLPAAALLVALNGDIVRLVLPADYHGRVDQLFLFIAIGVICANLMAFVYGSVVLSHKRPWLLVVPNGIGSASTIALSFLLIPPLAEVGAALAFAGGSAVGLAVSILIANRLTPVPVPWRDLAVSAAIAGSCGIVAALTSNALADMSALVRLAIGGGAGGLVFLALNSAFHLKATLALAGRLGQRFKAV